MGHNRVAAALVAGMALFATAPVFAAGFKTLYRFQGATGKGPEGPLIFDTLGNLYGVTGGSEVNDGSIFKFNPKTKVLTPLHTFSGASDGSVPSSGLVLTSPTTMYGLTNSGGTSNFGTIFDINLTTNVVTVDDQIADTTNGSGFLKPMIVGKNNVLYGTAPLGGVGGDCGLVGGCGTVFTFDPATNTLTTLHAFVDGADGAHPGSSLFVNSDGYYYGVAETGGALGGGVIYKIDPATNAFSVVYSFNRTSGPVAPQGQLAAGSNGTFYGTTLEDAQNPPSDLYSFNPATGQMTVLGQLGVRTEGFEPLTGLTLGSTGALCGATVANGPKGFGAVFCFNPASSVFSVVEPIVAKKTGAESSPLLAGPSTMLYGSMSDVGYSGSNNVPYGSLYSIQP